ncbi:CaiB/BaiF CoA transferase family protein [Diaphorobacter aerolatus]|uniref:CoA transferase n=1 Tax=Diaphorobacter aerolatus TaxID=1288495 RepID=A0A7H0GN04_9BURK|nr:CoA transferase [Diaphorobacter aerolatus]QNP49670.1 CoA transferase [Diaphorobacter aerolatus]
MSGPLIGIRILDLTGALSGPVATQLLGDMGADVIKIESPEGDSIRAMGPARHAGMGAMFLHANRSKRSLVLDLKQGSARDALLKLVAKAEVLVTNTRPKALARLGLSYEDLKAINPSLIYVNIVGYGSSGPDADKPAYDDLIQAAAGIPSLHGPSDAPRYAPIAIADRVTGICAANAVLGALFHRLRSGQGQFVEVPMLETVASLVLADHMAGLTFEPAQGPAVFQRYAAIRRPFTTRDGSICLMVLTDRQWNALFKVLGHEGAMDDPRFRTMSQRTQHLEALYELVAYPLKERTTEDWIARLGAADIPVARLETMDSLLSDGHLVKSGFFGISQHPTEGDIRVMKSPSTWSATQPGPSRPTPNLGEHSREILREAGLSSQEIQSMFETGATKE